jgi:glycosyltransferase involved in cell wall biosynthesis
MEQPYLSVIIPAYNEAKRLPPTLIDIDHKLSAAGFSYEIVVVNDASRDETATIVKKMSADIPHLRLIDNDTNKGKGGVVRQGMLETRGQIRLFMDADGSTSIDHFFAMQPFFKEGYAVVIGSRAIKGSQLDPPEPLIRQIPGKAGNLLIQLVNLPGIWDTQCGFKAFTAEAADKVFTLSKIPGWGFDIEILSLAKTLGYKIKEIPVRWVNKEGSTVKPSAYLKVFVENLTIRYWLLTDQYGLKAKKSQKT